MKTPEGIGKLTKGDWVYRTIRGGLSAIPIASEPLAEIFASILEELIHKRRLEWIRELSKRLSDLEKNLNHSLYLTVMMMMMTCPRKTGSGTVNGSRSPESNEKQNLNN